jgi:hypothetical protein
MIDGDANDEKGAMEMDETRDVATEQEAAAVSASTEATEPENQEQAQQGSTEQAAAQSQTNPKNDSQSEQGDGQKPKEDKAAAGGAAGRVQSPAEGDPGHAGADDVLVKTQEQLANAKQALLTTSAEAAAARLGIPEGRVKHMLRMADLKGIDPMAVDAGPKVQAALEKVLEDVPELRGGTGTGSPGAFARQKEPTAAEKAEADFRRGLGIG